MQTETQHQQHHDLKYQERALNTSLINAPLAITGNASIGGAITTPKDNVFNITTTSGTTHNGQAIDGVQVRNGSNQSIVTVRGDTRATLFEGDVGVEWESDCVKI